MCCCCLGRFGEYSLHDLVILDQQTMGVIIAIHANSCKVLTNQVCRLAPFQSICVPFWQLRTMN